MPYIRLMAIQGYIGWPTQCNRIILDSTNITLGDNALRTEALESGYKRSIVRSAFIPEKYQVVMTFNWSKEINNTGKTEFDYFTDWYKYMHKYGQVPFEFPKLLYSSNTGIDVLDTVSQRPASVEFYKITSAVTGQKSGEDVEVTMTWETVYGGTVSIPTPTPSVFNLEAHPDYADIHFVAVSSTAPTSNDFQLYIGNTLTPITGFCYDGSLTVRLYYAHQTHATVTFAIPNYAGLTVAKGTYTSSF